MKKLYLSLIALSLFAFLSKAGNTHITADSARSIIQQNYQIQPAKGRHQAPVNKIKARSLIGLETGKRHDIYNDTTSSWVYSDSGLYLYDNHNDDTLYATFEYTGSVWTGLFRESNFFDANGNENSDIEQDWDTYTNAYVNYERDSFYYDANGREIEYLDQLWDTTNNVWDNYYKDLYILDANGNTLDYFVLYWDGTNDVFDSSIRFVYTYDGHNNVSSIVFQDYGNNGWVNDRQDIYTYDANNNLTKDSNQVWTLNGWINMTEKTYAFNANNQGIKQTAFKWDTTNMVWAGTTESVEYLDANGNDTSEYDYNWDTANNSFDITVDHFIDSFNASGKVTVAIYQTFDSYSSMLVNNSETTSTYDGNNNNIGSEDYSWDSAGQVWVPYDSNSDQYDANNNLIYRLFQVADVNNSLVYSDQYFYYYMEATGINEVKNELGATLFPNPASDDVNMQFSLLQPSAMMMRVYDMDGRVVLSELQNLPGGANNLAIGVKDIAQGLYTVQLVNVTTQQSSVLKLEKQ